LVFLVVLKGGNIKMSIKIGAFGYGIGALCAAGAILLTAMGNSSWGIFLTVAVVIWILSTLIRKL